MSFRETFARIDLNALIHNMKAMHSLLPQEAFFCPMVKANAYGHGMSQVARALVEENAQNLGVALVEEGLLLRQLGLEKTNILVFGYFDRPSIEAMYDHQLIPVLNSLPQLELVSEVLKGCSGTLQVHFKFDTGMRRLGFSPEHSEQILRWLKKENRVKLRGICSHLVRAEDSLDAEGITAAQVAQFENVCEHFLGFEIDSHLLNSAGMAARQFSPLFKGRDWGGRPGIALYGYLPEIENLTSDARLYLQGLSLKPVMDLKSHVKEVRRLEAGESVSYGPTWRASRPSLIGVVPVGYGDGYPRLLSNKSQVIIRGQKVPVIGTVCMDYLMVDLTDLECSKSKLENSEVLLFGAGGLTANEVAGFADTIPYEITTSVASRVARQFVK